MILSTRQYHVSRAALEKLRADLLAAEKRTSGHGWIRDAEILALREQIREITSELSEYSLLTSGQVSFSRSYALEELPSVLVKARIASGISQTQLAVRLNLKPQQIQRYESSGYLGASLARLIEVSRALGVKASGAFELPRQSGGSVLSLRRIDDIVWSQLPYKEMIRRQWFPVHPKEDPLAKARAYFLNAAGPTFATAYHRKKIRSGRVPNEYALLAWQVRILERARARAAKRGVPEFVHEDVWISDLVELTRLIDGPRRACHLLERHGIPVVVERHLPGSYLDGGSMLYGSNRPVVGLTLRYDRLDNFWFVLFHEVAHILLHLTQNHPYDFFDEDVDAPSASGAGSIESEADNYALDALIPEPLWNKCISRFDLSAEAVLGDAQMLNIHPSIVAGRIRRERNDYTLFANLVGQGTVRNQLEAEESGPS